MHKKLSIKQKDPSSFTIACIVGNQTFGKALCDLGANISLKSSSIFNRLHIDEIKPTSIALWMTDRSVSYTKGIVENVLVKVEHLIYPTDFVVLVIPEDVNVPLILGRPFVAT